jgi:bifunctional DNase/RNase
MRVVQLEEMDVSWTEVGIRGVVIDPVSGEPTILLEDSQRSTIIAVPGDPAATGALISELEGVEHEPAQTMLYRFFVRHGVNVESLELSQDRTGTLGAYLRYRFGEEQFGMEVRAVDGLIIAIQTQAPILVHHALIEAENRLPVPRVIEGRDLLILSRRTHD